MKFTIFYLGDPVEMLFFMKMDLPGNHPGTGHLEGEYVQFVAPAGAWQGSHLLTGGSFALLGTTMAPGYEDSDYLEGQRQALIKQFPHERI